MVRREIAIVACSERQSTKLKVYAEERYQGSLFRYSLAYTREVLGLPEPDIYVLSTKYGLLIPKSIIPEPYDVGVNEVSKDFWEKVAVAIEQERGEAEELLIYAFIGQETIQDFQPLLSPSCRLVSIYDEARKSVEKSSYGRILNYLKETVEAKRKEAKK